MPLVKRYPNRKLYDTAAKQYISLDDITDFIRRGEDVQVVDHATGEDLTALILTQIIVEQEKQQSGFLPQPVLTGLIQSGGATLANLRRSLLIPLDFLRHVDEEIERRLQQLVGLGELAEVEAQTLQEKLIVSGKKNEASAGDEAIRQELRSRALPTRADLQRLSVLLDRLSAEVEELAEAKARLS